MGAVRLWLLELEWSWEQRVKTRFHLNAGVMLDPGIK